MHSFVVLFQILLFCCNRRCRGAKVVVANRNRQRAEQLVGAMQSSDASVVDWADLQAGQVKADVLANSTSIGMAPKVDRGVRAEVTVMHTNSLYA